MTKNYVHGAAVIVTAALVAVVAGIIAGVMHPVSEAHWVEDGWAVVGDQAGLFDAFMWFHSLLAVCGLVLGGVLRARHWGLTVPRVLGVIIIGAVATHVVTQVAGFIAQLRAGTPDGFPDSSAVDLGVDTVHYATSFGTMPATWGVMAFVATTVWWLSEFLLLGPRDGGVVAELNGEGIDAHQHGVHG